MDERMARLWQLRKQRPRRPRPGTEDGTGQGEAGSPPTALPPPAAKPHWRNRSLWLTLLLFLAGSFIVSFIISKALIVPTVPPELVGTWKVETGVLKGATLEFRSDGAAIATMYKQGKKAVTNSTARVEGKTLLLTTRDEKTGKEEMVSQRIVELTADELVLRDEDLMTYHMKRFTP